MAGRPRKTKEEGKRTVAVVEKEIIDLEKRIEELKVEKDQLLFNERAERLGDLDTLISESGLTMAQVKKAIKDTGKAKAKKTKTVRKPRAKKEENTISSEEDTKITENTNDTAKTTTMDESTGEDKKTEE